MPRTRSENEIILLISNYGKVEFDEHFGVWALLYSIGSGHYLPYDSLPVMYLEIEKAMETMVNDIEGTR